MPEPSQQNLILTVPEVRGTNYELWAEIIPCSVPADTVCLRFSTAWTGARDPEARQIKGEYFLDTQARQALVGLLNKATI